MLVVLASDPNHDPLEPVITTPGIRDHRRLERLITIPGTGTLIQKGTHLV
jgi:hypothetical protein